MDQLPNILKQLKNLEEGNLTNLYKNELNKAWFAHDAACFNIKGLAKGTNSDNISKNTYETARNC